MTRTACQIEPRHSAFDGQPRHRHPDLIRWAYAPELDAVSDKDKGAAQIDSPEAFLTT